MGYRKTQIGYHAIVALGIALIFSGFIAEAFSGPNTSGELLKNAVFLVLLFLLITFSTLTIRVDRRELVWFFGPGLWKYRVPMDDIYSVTQTELSKHEGFGIRWSGVKGWAYTVSGKKAVKLIRKSGKSARIGTPEPEALIEAIQEAKRYL
jgi:hypothetical protein